MNKTNDKIIIQDSDLAPTEMERKLLYIHEPYQGISRGYTDIVISIEQYRNT